MRNYVNFRGRARRREFWMFTLFNTLVYLAVGLVLLGAVIYKSVAEGGDAAEHATAYTLAVAGLLLLVYGWMLATFLPGLAVRVRRLHDIGLSGKWLLGYYALYWVCFYWMSTSYMQFAEDGALEGLSGQQSAAAIWIVVRPMLRRRVSRRCASVPRKGRIGMAPIPRRRFRRRTQGMRSVLRIV